MYHIMNFTRRECFAMASSAVVAGLGLPQLALAEQSDGSDAEALPLNANDDLEFSFTPTMPT